MLQSYDGLSAVHIVSHGAEGSVLLGNSQLTNVSLSGYSGEIAEWSNSLALGADLLFYGCDLASNQDGQLLLESISALTGADVAASEDLTGHVALGGDWELEFSTGEINNQIAFSQIAQQQWLSLLTVTASNDGYVISEGSTLNQSAPGVLDNDLDGPSGTIVGGATLNYDASLDTNGNNLWEDSTGISGYDWTLDGTVTLNTALSNAPQGITAAYVFDGTNGGVISDTLMSLPGDPTDGSATFEIWFRPNDPSVTTGILFDTGSQNNGTNLRIYESGGNTFIEYVVLQDTSFPAIRPIVTADITSEMASGEFIQIAGTIDVVTGTVELFVNGVSVGSDTNASLNDWSDGTEGSGLAQRDVTMSIQNGPQS